MGLIKTYHNSVLRVSFISTNLELMSPLSSYCFFSFMANSTCIVSSSNVCFQWHPIYNLKEHGFGNLLESGHCLATDRLNSNISAGISKNLLFDINKDKVILYQTFL